MTEMEVALSVPRAGYLFTDEPGDVHEILASSTISRGALPGPLKRCHTPW